MKELEIMWLIIKALLHLPIYRIDVLNWAEYLYVGSHNSIALCPTLSRSCRNLNLGIRNDTKLQIYFPKYSRKYAQNFNENYLPSDRAFWWRINTWDTNGRLGFFLLVKRPI